MKTIYQIEGKLEDKDFVFDYQKKLTKRLDKIERITKTNLHEIVLWKLNRYFELSKESFYLLNKVKINSHRLNKKLTKEILISLLSTNGIRLPMASTILRFKNPKIYQIIDQRVYRFILGEELKINSNKSEKNIDEQISLYIDYLSKLKNVCKKFKVPYRNSDRIFYNADRRVNKKNKINY